MSALHDRLYQIGFWQRLVQSVEAYIYILFLKKALHIDRRVHMTTAHLDTRSPGKNAK